MLIIVCFRGPGTLKAWKNEKEGPLNVKRRAAVFPRSLDGEPSSQLTHGWLRCWERAAVAEAASLYLHHHIMFTE